MIAIYCFGAMYVVLSFLLGGALASAFVCCIQRTRNGKKWFDGNNAEENRSHCCSCGHVLSAMDLLPFFGYLFLRGKCRYCGAAIPHESFIAEAVTGTVFALGALVLFATMML